MNIFPGFGSPDIKSPEALPEPVKRDDPSVLAAKERLKQSQKRRKGRQASILTGPSGVSDSGGASVLG